MKLIVFFLCVMCIQVKAGNAQRVNLSLKDVSLKQIFNEIEKQTGYHFFYKDKLLNNSIKTSVNLKDIPLRDALDESIEQSPLKYSIVGNMIILSEKTIYGNSEIIKPNLISKFFIEIRGVVKDKNDGKPLQGVSVLVKGTIKGTSTKKDGTFSINANIGDFLEFSMVGYKSESVQIGTSTNLTVEMQQTVATSLDNVVVIGYGTQQKSEVTGSMSNVQGNAVADKPISSFEDALGGRATGVQVIANQGILNEAPVFQIRGTNSLSLSTYPLVVVDGVPVVTENMSDGGLASNNPLAGIDPSDIQSIDIAKDAAATSIYGSRAANGVVFITTKSGRRGEKARVSLTGSFGFNNPVRLAKVLNAAQYLEIKNEGLKNAGTYNPVSNYYDYSHDANGNIIDTRWYDYIFHTGTNQDYHINLSGGSESTSYYFSIGYTNNQGIYIKNNFERKTINYNITHKVNNWLRIGTTTSYTENNTSAVLNTGRGGGFSANSVAYRLGMISAPIVGPYNNDGTFNVIGPNIGIMDNAGHLTATPRMGYTNPVLTLSANSDNTGNNFIKTSNFFEISPTKWVTFKSLYGYNRIDTRVNRYMDPRTNEGQSSGGRAYAYSIKRQTTLWTNTATFQHSFNKHSLNLLLGIEDQTNKRDGFGLTRSMQTDPYYRNIQGGYVNVAVAGTDNNDSYNYLLSKFSRVQYNFERRFYATGSIRRDESSVLGANHKGGTFWGFSGAWQINKENFWMNTRLSKVLNNLKLNASYGKVGNIGGLGDYISLSTYNADLYGTAPALYYAVAGNPELHWETSKKLDIGVDFGMFDNRLSGEITFYKNNIDGLIFSVPVPASAGLPGSPINSVLSNVGKMSNTGLEISLNGILIQRTNFLWRSTLNISSNKNKIISLAKGVDQLITEGGAGAATISMPGHPIGVIYAVRTDGVDPQSGRRVFLDGSGRRVLFQQVAPTGGFQWEYEDGSIAPPISEATDAVPVATTQPKVYGGFSNHFEIRNFDIDMLITYQVGGHIFYGTQSTLMDERFQNNSVLILKRWQKPGDITNVPRVIDGDITSWGYSLPISADVFKSDFARIQNLTVGYTLSKKIMNRIKFRSVRIYGLVQNLLLVTNYPGSDPEVTSEANSPTLQGIDKNMAPNVRSFVFGIQIGF